MNSSLSLIKALANTLISELDSLEADEATLDMDGNFRLIEKVREFEIKLIKVAMLKTGGNQRNASKLLGVKNSTLHNKIKVYKIEVTKSPVPASFAEQILTVYSH